MSKIELIKRLKYMVAFQTNCLNEGNWDEFDRMEVEIEKMENSLLANCGE